MRLHCPQPSRKHALLVPCLIGATTLLLAATAMPFALASDQVQNTAGGGLSGALFDTKYGQIKILFPADAQAGDTISGTIFLQPKGSSKSEQSRNEDQLNDYAVDLGSKQALTRLPEFVITIPPEATSIPVSLKDKKGTVTASTQLTVKPHNDQPPLTQFIVPIFAQGGWPFRCTGPFGGDLSDTSAQLSGRTLTKMAESPRSLVLECPTGIQGPGTLEVKERSVSFSAPLSAVFMKVTAPKADLPRGETMQLLIHVEGTQSLSVPMVVHLDNRTPSIVRLEGGDSQDILIAPGSTASEVTRNITGVANGPFLICAWANAQPGSSAPPASSASLQVSGRTVTPPKTASQTPQPSSGAASAADSVVGTWNSSWGPVTITAAGVGNVNPVPICGSWQQAANKTGIIKSGTYDSASRTLKFSYFQPWNNTSGTANFSLSNDGRTFQGYYRQPGLTGKWTLTRQ